MPTTHDMRRHARYVLSQKIGIMWCDAIGDDKFMKASARDLSEAGVGLELPEELQVRSYVILRASELGIHGRASVRHCQRQGLKYIVGVEFSGGMRWKGLTA